MDAKKIRENNEVGYGAWEINPESVQHPTKVTRALHPEMTVMKTMHEGKISYLRFWNFWVRVGTPAHEPTETFFHNYESGSKQVRNLLTAIGVPTAWPRTEKEIWKRIATVWSWLGANVRVDGATYSAITAADRWPSINELAVYFADHDELVWSACFSKAHLFAVLLGRILPRWHIFIASAHHTEGGAPPTASHVYVGIYLTGRWFYLDPTAVYSYAFPSFSKRRSIGIFKTVDYQHPFSARPVPLSPLDKVPYLEK